MAEGDGEEQAAGAAYISTPDVFISYASQDAALADTVVADRLADEAAGQLRRGHKISARDSYLRACSYYRSAEFFLHANHRIRGSSGPTSARLPATRPPRRSSRRQ